MHSILCDNHITYAEIEKYLDGSDADFFQDASFFENFDNRVDNCDVCSKRLRAYSFLSSMTQVEVLADDVSTEAVKEVMPEEPEPLPFMRYLREKLGDTINFISDNISFSPMSLANAFRGIKGVSEDVKDVCNVTVKENENFFDIELSKETSLLINMRRPVCGKKYELYLWSVTEECDKGEPYIFEETMEEGLLAVETELLEAGTYIAVVVVADNG